MAEFTGERVIPGQVDADLWNEHFARYLFALNWAKGKRVLDAGCGSGYGGAELARCASRVAGVDLSAEAVNFARGKFPLPNLDFLRGSCDALPFANGAFDLIVSFEVIEHLHGWREFLAEARRVLAPDGYLLISTPNREYYAEARGEKGPNEYHVHEFDFDEFASALRAYFPEISLYVQNHVGAICFSAPENSGSPNLSIEQQAADPLTANFFLALCGTRANSAARAFVHVPSAANVLRERELHIEKLEGLLEGEKTDKQKLVDLFRAQTGELERSNRWAAELDGILQAARKRISELQEEVAAAHIGYQQELQRCIALLDKAEKTVIERTEWAQRAQAQLEQVKSSPLFRIARSLRLVPKVKNG